jgi:hypothetical protein
LFYDAVCYYERHKMDFEKLDSGPCPSLTQREGESMKKQEYMPWTAMTPVMSVVLLLFAWGALQAQEDLEKPPKIPNAVVEEEPLPPKVQDEQLEPTVTIREEEDRRIEEYRMNGRVYMIKVTPEEGVPYYYVDTDGDGQLELDVDQQALNPVQPVHWKIKEWK